MAQKYIEIKGARQHNLKNIDVKVPKGKFTVVTGPSGSGKSSLAFNTIFAEGQRRYLESLSTYARQFLDKQEKPELDDIKGITPTIAIEQKNHVKSSRSTVGTATEIYDFLRLLYAKLGVMICPDTGKQIKRDLVKDIIKQLNNEYSDKKVYICFPSEIAATAKSGDRKRLLGNFLERGFTKFTIGDSLKVKIKDPFLDIQEVVQSKKSPFSAKSKLVLVSFDRLEISAENSGRLEEALIGAYKNGFGRLFAVVLDDNKKVLFSKEYTEFPSAGKHKRYPELTPALFSFNTPLGACPSCKGFGSLLQVDEFKVVPNPKLTIAQGAVEPLTKPSCRFWLKELLLFCQEKKIPLNKPWLKMTKKNTKLILNGEGDFKGVKQFLEDMNSGSYKVEVRVFLSRYRSSFPCNDCQGERLRLESRIVQFHNKRIGELTSLSMIKLADWFDKLKLTREQNEAGVDILSQIKNRLSFLIRVGLGYLTLSRLTKTLSGGESQRIALANQLASRLNQTTYVLDEPSIGLHPRDTENLVTIIKELTKLNNTAIVVEHDLDIIKHADYLLDIGPQAGEAGGNVVYAGPYAKFEKTFVPKSITSQFLHKKEFIPVPSRRRPTRYKDLKKEIKYLTIDGCREHNLKNVKVKVPLNMLCCITGVSGSGKSTAIRKTLYPALCRKLLLKAENPGLFSELKGYQGIRGVKLINQDPIGKSPRSNPITFIKSYDAIRNLFASTKAARQRRFHAGHFSFNVTGGRCDHCDGDGYNRVEMVFMEDLFLKCEYCDGKRFKDQILKITYNGKNIHDVLSMTISESISFFEGERRLVRNLEILEKVGLGYLRLGQPSNTLSGGECQRLKIARELLQSNNTEILYILDEPTTGLHFRDVKILTQVLHELVERGNSCLVIEHNTDVMKSADWIIDFGPDGGDRGGEVVAEGTPEQVAKNKKSYTAKYIAEALKSAPKRTMTQFLGEEAKIQKGV